MAKPIEEFRTRLRHASLDAAQTLADATEWASAGQMLRVHSILAGHDRPEVALPFALNARADALNEEGRAVCGIIIRDIELLAADWPKAAFST